MDKTALQELIEGWEEIQNTTSDSSTKAICGAFIDHAKRKLDQERQQIEGAYRSGCDEVENTSNTGSDYYQSKYTKGG